MPPAKKDPPTAAASVQAQQEAASDGIDYYELPKALVQRIAKSSIPESSKLQKETVTALQKGSTVFINYLAATAHDIATSRQHKSISASDVLKALEVIQFGDMVEPLQHELQIYRENAKNPKKGTASANKSASAGTGAGASEIVSSNIKSANQSAKAKGKERVGEGVGPSPLSTSVSAAEVGAEGDAHMNSGSPKLENGRGDASAEEDEGDGGEDEEDELADDVDLEEEGEEPEEELEDRMVVDEEDVMIRQHEKAAELGGIDGGE